DRPHHGPSSPRLDETGRRGGQTTPTDPRSKRNRTSRRGGHRKARAHSPSSKNRPAQHAFPRKPLSRSSDPNRAGPETTALEHHFHAPTLSRPGRGIRTL